MKKLWQVNYESFNQKGDDYIVIYAEDIPEAIAKSVTAK